MRRGLLKQQDLYMQFLTTLVMAIVEGIKAAGLWALGSAEAIGATIFAVLSSTGFWSVAAIAAVVGGVITYLVKTDRILLLS